MVVAELLRLQQFVKVGLHQVLYDVAETLLKNYNTSQNESTRVEMR